MAQFQEIVAIINLYRDFYLVNIRFGTSKYYFENISGNYNT